MTPLSTSLPVPKRALAVGAHPDDIEFGCGATLATWAAAGTDIHLLVLTDGSKGTWDGEADLGALVAERRREQQDAATTLGARDVHFLDFVDGELENGPVELAALARAIRAVRPDVVLGHDPWKRYRLHPDHLLAGRLLVGAVVAARDPHFFAGQGAAHRPERLLLFEAEEVDHIEDAVAGFDAKIEALLCHRTQWRSTMGIEDGPDRESQRAAFVARVRADANRAGAPVGFALGEDFKRIDAL